MGRSVSLRRVLGRFRGGLDLRTVAVVEIPAGPLGSTKTFCPSASIAGRPWACVYTKPRAEIVAEHRVRAEGFAAWLPMHQVIHRPHRGVPFTTHRPIFPRYLFVQDYRWTVVRNAGGEELGAVLRSPAGVPLSVPESVLEVLWSQCAANGVIYPPEPRQVRRSDTVRVLDGPFAGFAAVCSRTSRERVWLLLSIFGRSSEIDLKRGAVELVTK